MTRISIWMDTWTHKADLGTYCSWESNACTTSHRFMRICGWWSGWALILRERYRQCNGNDRWTLLQYDNVFFGRYGFTWDVVLAGRGNLSHAMTTISHLHRAIRAIFFCMVLWSIAFMSTNQPLSWRKKFDMSLTNLKSKYVLKANVCQQSHGGFLLDVYSTLGPTCILHSRIKIFEIFE